MKFRKYKNRKIYCCDTSAYVTLPDLLTLARAGETIQVECNHSRTDITSQVLLQAVATERNVETGRVLSFIRGS